MFLRIKLLAILLVPVLVLSCAMEARLYNSESYIRSRVVQLEGNGHACSATQIRSPHGADYLLTAAHCLVLADANQNISAKTDDGRLIPRRIIEEDKNSDLLLLEGIPNLPGLRVADVSPTIGSTLRAFTHGMHFATFKSEGELFQMDKVEVPLFAINTDDDAARCASAPKYRVVNVPMQVMGITLGEAQYCELSIDAYYTRLVIAPGSSGGNAVNSWGELVGVVFAGDKNDVFGFVVPLTAIQEFLKPY